MSLKSKIIFFIFVTLIFLLSLLYFKYLFRGPYNDSWAYHNIVFNYKYHHTFTTNEIFPNTIRYISSFPAPLIRRSFFYPLLLSLLPFSFPSSLYFAYISAFFWILNLTFIFFLLIRKHNCYKIILFFLPILLFPKYWELAFSGVIEPLYSLLLTFLFLILTRKKNTLLYYAGYIFIIILFLLRPHTIFIVIGLLIVKILAREKTNTFFLLLTTFIALSILTYFQPYPSFSKYFLINEINGFKNHNFERILSPPPILKTLFQHKISFFKKIIKNIIKLIEFIYLYPFFSLNFFLLIWSILIKKKKKLDYQLEFALLILLVLLFLFEIFFIVKFRYFYPFLPILIYLNINFLFSFFHLKINQKTLIIFMLMTGIFLFFKVKSLNSKYPLEYFSKRELVLQKWKTKIKKLSPQGIFIDIPWCGASILKIPSIWIPAKWEDLIAIQKKFQINYLLVTNFWIEKDKIIENFDINRLQLVSKLNYIYYGKHWTSFLYKLPDLKEVEKNHYKKQKQIR